MGPEYALLCEFENKFQWQKNNNFGKTSKHEIWANTQDIGTCYICANDLINMLYTCDT